MSDTIWICAACGKRSADRYGYHPIDGGWDESCMLNAYEANRWTGMPINIAPPEILNSAGRPFDEPVNLALPPKET